MQSEREGGIMIGVALKRCHNSIYDLILSYIILSHVTLCNTILSYSVSPWRMLDHNSIVCIVSSINQFEFDFN